MMPVFGDCRCGKRGVCQSGLRQGLGIKWTRSNLLTAGGAPRTGRDRVPQAFRFEGFVSEISSSSSSSSDSAIPAAADELPPLS